MHEGAREIFARTANGCSYRQIKMALNAEQHVKVSGKTVLKIMKEEALYCRIRKKGNRQYSSFRGESSQKPPNIINWNFEAEAPLQKLGTDVTEFAQPWGKVYLAPIYDFVSKEILA